MGLVSGNAPDTGKLLEAVSEMITDENVKSVIVEIHKKYQEEAAKLGEGHILTIGLSPDHERGLTLTFLDFVDENTAPQIIKTIYLAELTAADIQAFLKQTTGQAESQPLLVEGGQSEGKTAWQQKADEMQAAQSLRENTAENEQKD